MYYKILRHTRQITRKNKPSNASKMLFTLNTGDKFRLKQLGNIVKNMS
jgi:hypothetical protein